MRKINYLFLPVILLGLSLISYATFLASALEAPGVRSMGMGGASLAFLDDASSMLANPATLTKIETISLVGSGIVDLSSKENWWPLIDYLFNENTITSGNASLKSEGYGFVGFSTNRFGLGLSPALILEKDGDKTTVSSLNTSNLALALPLGIIAKALDSLALGVNIKLHHAKVEDYNLNVEPFKLATKAGTGEGFDIGLLVDIGRFRLGFTGKDLFSQIVWDGTSEPTKLHPYFNVGLLWDLGFTRNPGKTLIALDYTDLYLTQGDFNGVLRIGLEQALFKVIKLRSGAALTDAFTSKRKLEYSAGLGLELGPIGLDAAVTTKDFFKDDLGGSLGLRLYW